MNPLEGFLAKFSNLMKTSRDSKKTVLEVFQKVLGIGLDEKEIEVKSHVLYLYTSPAVKNEIYMHKVKF
jgi:hypothetical protein